MKKFTKLALISSMAISANAMAMQAMDDSALSATTGQDGLSIGIGISKIAIERLFIHDNDGLAANGAAGDAGYGGTGNAGAIVIMGKNATATSEATAGQWTNPSTDSHAVVIGANYEQDGQGKYLHLLDSKNLADLVIDSDAGTAADGGAFINIAAAVSGLDIQIGAIGVTASANSKADYDAGLTAADSIRRGGGTTVNKILSGLDIKTGKMNANIQVGAAPQGAMIKLDTIMSGGLEINKLGLLDNSTKDTVYGLDGTTPLVSAGAGELYIESIKLADAKSKDLTIDQSISIYTTAKDTTDPTIGTAGFIKIVSHGGPKDNYVAGIRIGGAQAASIGDVEVQGLQTYYGSPNFGTSYTPGAVITIKGH